MLRCLRWRLWGLLVLLILPGLGGAQTQLLNSNVVVVGHLNACTTGPTSTPVGPPTAYACTLGAAITAYQTQACYGFTADVANTGAATLNLHSLGAKSLVKTQGGVTTALVANDIRAGMLVRACYDGTNMQCQNCTGNSATGASISGTPTAGQAAEFTNATTIQGVTPTRSVYIPAGAMSVEGGCAVGTAAALVTSGPVLPPITCTDTNTDGIDVDVLMPDGWNGGTLTVELDGFYAGTPTGSQLFSMNFSGQCVRSGDSIAAWAVTSGATATSGSNVATTLTMVATANLEYHNTSAALTLSGTCAGGAHIYLHGLVNATTTNLTTIANLKIVGIKLEYTRSGND